MRRSLLLVLSLAAVTTTAAAQTADSLPTGPLTLLQAIRLGRERGIQATLARVNQRIVDSRIGQKKADLLPTIEGSADYARQTSNIAEFGFPAGLFTLPSGGTVVPAFNVYRARLSAQQTLFDAGAFTRLREARDTAIAAGMDAKAVGEIAGATAGLAYLRVLSAQETVIARQADSAVAATLLDQARELVKAGVSPTIDATRSEVSFAAVRTQLEVGRNALDRSRLDLLRALDLPPGATIVLADSLGIGQLSIPRDPSEGQRYALAHRAELRADQARLVAAKRALRAIGFEQLPSLVASGYGQETGQSPNTLAATWAFQLGLRVPIIDGFRREARRDEQRARIDAQEIRLHDTERQIATEARQSLLDVTSSEEQVRIAIDRLRLAELELSEAQERFKAGVAGSVETTNAQSSVISARDALIQARVNFGTARVTAYRALGAIDQIP